MQTTPYIWMDGKFVPWKKAQVHVLTSTLHYGAGAFEGIRFYNTPRGPAVFRLKEHMKRLFYSAKAIGMKIPFSEKQLCDATTDLLRKCKIKSGYIRPLVIYGYGGMSLNVSKNPVQVMIACWGWGKYLGDSAIHIKTSPFIRIHPQSLVADAKICGHYVNSILATLDAVNSGYDEALFLDYKGDVAEGPGENIFMVKKRVLYTPPLGTTLNGITRDSVMTVARGLGYKVVEKRLKLKDLLAADECFFTGTAAEVTAIGSIDRKKISNGKGGPVTAQIKKAYMEIVGERNPKYSKWLTPIG